MPVTTGTADEPEQPMPHEMPRSAPKSATRRRADEDDAIAAAANTSHLSCSRSSPRERRKRTTSAAMPTHDEAPETLKTSKTCPRQDPERVVEGHDSSPRSSSPRRDAAVPADAGGHEPDDWRQRR